MYVDDLHIYRIDLKLIKFLARIIDVWHTPSSVRSSEGINTSQAIRIQEGILQGDSLGPVWFCMATSLLLNDTRRHDFTIKYSLLGKC